MSSRPFASATITLGPVRIPVKLHPTVAESKPPFVRAHAACGTKAAMLFECSTCNERVGEKDFGRYVESGGKLLPLLPGDLAEVEREPTHAITASEAVPLKSVPRYGALASYFLLPDVGAAKPFAHLVRALVADGIALVVRWDGRGGERLACLYPPTTGGSSRPLVLEVRAWGDEVRSIHDLPQAEEVNGHDVAEYRALRSAVAVWSHAAFDPAGHLPGLRKIIAGVVARVVERELIAGPEGLRAALRASVGTPKEPKKAAEPRRSRGSAA